MGYQDCDHDHRDRCHDSIREELEGNIDNFVCVTTSGGCFNGLLTGVSDDAIKIICRNRITIVRLRDVEAVTFCGCNFC